MVTSTGLNNLLGIRRLTKNRKQMRKLTFCIITLHSRMPKGTPIRQIIITSPELPVPDLSTEAI
jgi:hypothetical protein